MQAPHAGIPPPLSGMGPIFNMKGYAGRKSPMMIELHKRGAREGRRIEDVKNQRP
ncbi:hypothetical protein ACSS6W_001297 [Trichoderma asperelloides]